MMRKLHPKTVWEFRVHAFFMFIFLAIILSLVLFVFAIFVLAPIFGLMTSAIISFLILFGFFLFMMIGYPKMAYNNWRYEFTNTELKTESGVIFKNYKSIPYQRIQNVEIRRGVVARFFGYSSLVIHTAGYSGPMGAEGRLPGVSIQNAEKMRSWLSVQIRKGKRR